MLKKITIIIVVILTFIGIYFGFRFIKSFYNYNKPARCQMLTKNTDGWCNRHKYQKNNKLAMKNAEK